MHLPFFRTLRMTPYETCSIFLFLCILDDILIFYPDEETHKGHVRKVLKQLLDHQLYVKVKSVCFTSHRCHFWGLCYLRGEIRMDPAKVSAVADWATPHSRKVESSEVSGFCYFLIAKSFAVIAPLLLLCTI